MQLSTLALFAASASASAILQRQVPPQFIEGFNAACTPGPMPSCSYTFGVTSQPDVIDATKCAAVVPGGCSLPNVAARNDCKVNNFPNPAYFWSITKKSSGGLTFDVWYPYSSRTNLTFCRDIPATDIVTQNHKQYYDGPQSFEIAMCPEQRH